MESENMHNGAKIAWMMFAKMLILTGVVVSSVPVANVAFLRQGNVQRNQVLIIGRSPRKAEKPTIEINEGRNESPLIFRYGLANWNAGAPA